MSKWNVRTTAGVVNASQLKQPPPQQQMYGVDVESSSVPGYTANNPSFKGYGAPSPQSALAPAVTTGETIRHNRFEDITPALQSKKLWLRFCAFVFFCAAIGVTVGLLYPQQPAVYINRLKTVQQMHFTQPADPTTQYGLLYGNLSMVVTNNNVYGFKISNMNTFGFAGPSNAQMPFSAYVAELDIGGKATDTFSVYVSQALPKNFDYNGFLVWLGQQCLSTGSMTVSFGFNATVSALGFTLHISEGLTQQQAPCFTNGP